ncbi:MAG: nicotinate phosphoribosyltransferase [Bacteroidales bacterium]
MIHYSGTYTDQYQLSMALAYFRKERNQKAIFDYFFRKLPFGGGYAVFAGLDVLLDTLENLKFDENDLEFLRKNDFPSDFLDYLEKFRFNGTIHSSREGDIVFPTRPVVTIEANMIEAQIIETLLLNILNFQTLVATKASRMRLMAGDMKLVDFGMRRAQGPGAYYASRAAVIGGFDATSNTLAGRDFNVPVSGTMAHSFIQSYDNELEAFRDFAAVHADNCVLLVDTYDTLKSGVPNAITVGKEMKKRGEQLKGIRLDSGDLAYFAKEGRKLLDAAGLEDVKIAASNQLDEYVIKSLNDQDAPIDLFGVGTSLVTGSPDGALDGVYKLAYANGAPRIKLSENTGKITLPDRKRVFRLIYDDCSWAGIDAISLENEEDFRIIHHPFEYGKSTKIDCYRKEDLLVRVMENGKRTAEKQSLQEIAAFSRERLSLLPDEYKRFENPHIYKVGLSPALKELRDQMIHDMTERRG